MKSKIEVLNRVENTLKEANKFYEKYNEEFESLKSEILKVIEPMSYEETKEFFKEFESISNFKFKFCLSKQEILKEKKDKEFKDDNGLIFFRQIAPLQKFLNKEQLIELDYALMYDRKFSTNFLYNLDLKEEEVIEIIKFLCENNILIRRLYIDCPECGEDTLSIDKEIIDTYDRINDLKEKEKKETLSKKERFKLYALENDLDELLTFGCCDRVLTKFEIENAINDYKNYRLKFFNINEKASTNL